MSCQVFSSVLINGNIIVIILFVQINFRWLPANLSLSTNTTPGGGGLQRTKLLSENTEGIYRIDGMGVPVTVILMWFVLNKHGGIV